MKRFFSILICGAVLMSSIGCICSSIKSEFLSAVQPSITGDNTNNINSDDKTDNANNANTDNAANTDKAENTDNADNTSTSQNAQSISDEKWYRSYQLDNYIFQIPKYYVERENKDNSLIFATSASNKKEDVDAFFFLIVETADLAKEEYDAYTDIVTDSIIESFNIQNVNNTLTESVTISGITGEKVSGNASIEGMQVSFLLTHLYDSSRKNIILYLFFQQESSQIDYISDAGEIIHSMKVDSSVTKAPTSTPKATNKPTPTQKPTATPKQASVNYDAFCRIEMGSSLDDVKKLLGAGGKLSSSFELAGTKSETYSWEGSGFSYVSVSFSNGKVDSKTQYGLNTGTKAVTLAQYQKITNGMSYQQVVDIFGCNGYITSENYIMGTTTTMYQWDGNSWLSSATIMFQNGKVSSMSQYGLS